MQKISWIPTLVLYCVSSVLGLIIDLAALSSGSEASEGLALLFLPVLVVATVFYCILHHSCWKALPERHRSTTPGKAVGFLFIPFYNFILGIYQFSWTGERISEIQGRNWNSRD